jgi:hypothetical protein
MLVMSLSVLMLANVAAVLSVLFVMALFLRFEWVVCCAVLFPPRLYKLYRQILVLSTTIYQDL